MIVQMKLVLEMNVMRGGILLSILVFQVDIIDGLITEGGIIQL